jgi:WXXGXW repeat (2 copies)
MSTKVLGSIAACVFLSLTLLGCSSEVVIRTAPPAERVEVVGVAPSAQHFWIKGHWQWTGSDWAWTPGRWELRRASAVWQGGHWVAQRGGWVWVEGRWIDR